MIEQRAGKGRLRLEGVALANVDFKVTLETDPNEPSASVSFNVSEKIAEKIERSVGQFTLHVEGLEEPLELDEAKLQNDVATFEVQHVASRISTLQTLKKIL